MKEVKIVLDGKEYAKINPMVKDWRNLIECQIKNKGKNIITEFEPMQNIIGVIAEYVGAPADKIEQLCPVDMITTAFKAIDYNIAEAFTGTNEKNAEGLASPKKH